MKMMAHKHYVSIISDPAKLEKMQYKEWANNYKPVDPDLVVKLAKGEL